ncbi:MAG: hypothetical protein GY842_03050 [bacterium]|nr:hypothetical protein [bacterium]
MKDMSITCAFLSPLRTRAVRHGGAPGPPPLPALSLAEGDDLPIVRSTLEEAMEVGYS